MLGISSNTGTSFYCNGEKKQGHPSPMSGLELVCNIPLTSRLTYTRFFFGDDVVSNSQSASNQNISTKTRFIKKIVQISTV